MGQPEIQAASAAHQELRDAEIRTDLSKEELCLLKQELLAALNKAVEALTDAELKYMNKEYFYG